MASGSTRLPASMRAISATVRSRRLRARHARSRACWRRVSGSRTGAPGSAPSLPVAIIGIPRRSDGGDLGNLDALLVVDRLHQVLADAERLVDLRLDLLGD